MINSQVSGNGLPVVLIHGYGENLSIWNGIAAALSSKYKVITLDLPGFGESQQLEAPFTLAKVAETVHTYLANNLNIKRFVVLGHSLGGYISLELARSFPQSVLAFGLINSTSFADSDEKKANRKKTSDFITKYGAAFFLESFVPNLFTHKNQQKLSAQVALVLQMGINLPNSVLTSYMSAMASRPDLSNLLCEHEKILLVAGLLDPHFEYKDIMLEIGLLKEPNNGHIFEETAHMSMLESETLLVDVILDFLDSI
jgi:pimeloyl-ACP methyl ester carboxylesterase